MNPLMTALQQPLSVAALAQCLGWATGKPQPARRRRPGRRPAARRPPGSGPLHGDNGAATVPAPETESAAEGCGWFDSSHELHQGLLVLEHTGADGLGQELPVTVWLELVLGVTAQAEAAAPPTPGQGIIAA
jgi:hypothetical protein